MQALKEIFGKNHIVLSMLVIGLLGVLVYSNTFKAPFQWDESIYLQANPFVRGELGLFDADKIHDSVAAEGPDRVIGEELYRNLITRYVAYLSFALNYRIHRFDVRGYHIVNLAIHVINALLVYLLVRLFFATPALSLSSLRSKSGTIAFFSALLFVAHPIQTEAVTYVMQRLACLAAMFYLLSVVLYLKSRIAAGRRIRYGLYLGSIACAALAMKTKENAFTLPITLALFDFVLLTGSVRERFARLSPLLATLLIVPLTLFFLNSSKVAVPGQAGTSSALGYLLTQFGVIVSYLGLLAVPINQSILHDRPHAVSLFQPEVLLSVSLLTLLFGAGVYWSFRSRPDQPAQRVIGLGILWFFITLSVESSIIPLPIVLCEYRVYLPSVGVIFGVVTGIHVLAEAHSVRRYTMVAPVILGTIVILYSAATLARNDVWKKGAIWQDALEKNPKSGALRLQVGQALERQGRTDEAIELYESALSLGMNHPRIKYELGAAYLRSGRLKEAEAAYQEVVRALPDFAEAHFALGNILARQGRYEESVHEYEETIRLNPGHLDAHINLGGVYVQMTRYAAALQELREVLKQSPNHSDARYNMQVVTELLKRQGDDKNRGK